MEPHISQRSVDTVFVPQFNQGVRSRGCGSFLYFSQTAETYGRAQDFCSKFGLQLVSIETAEKFKCIRELARDARPENMVVKSRTFWTSATDFGCRNRIVWCGTGEIVSFNMTRGMFSSTRDDSVNKNCFIMNADKDLLTEEFCAAKYRFICEGKTAPKFSIINHPKCPAFECFVDFSKFFRFKPDLIAVHDRHETTPLFAKSKTPCTVGKVKLTFNRAIRECCAMGLQLYPILMNGLDSINPDFNKPKKYNGMSFWSLETLLLNGSNQYIACPFGNVGTHTLREEQNKTCVAYEFKDDKVIVSAANCDEEKYFVCMPVWQYTNDTVYSENSLETKMTCNPSCPSIPPETVDNYFLRSIADIRKAFPKDIPTSEDCGGVFVLPEGFEPATFWGAVRSCRSLGLQLAEITNYNQSECLYSRFLAEWASRENINDIWIGGSMLGCDKTFRWCGSDVTMSPKSFSPEINQTSANDECLVLTNEIKYNKNINSTLRLTIAIRNCYGKLVYFCQLVEKPIKK
ncbi:uncharacterized protein LOC135935003 [Cloeon dipterum]|uniref:uncharacterized protein LOC135935003 n=1 Tax=Cloeon dipterum TaxID=197152 RepID=UPI00322060FA